jgi:Kef-type K+ transport system membrane component KefB
LVAVVAVTGLALPFAAGLVVLGVVDLRRFSGASGNPVSFALVFACAIAVTSIPVISRIMHDLGILGTPFARVVLAVAIIEDVALYAVLAVALGLAGGGTVPTFGAPQLLSLTAGSWPYIAYHVGVTLAGIAVLLWVARLVASRRLRGDGWDTARFAVTARVATSLILLLGVTLLCLVLGIETFLGALLVGLLVGGSTDPDPSREDETHTALNRFSYAFFIPLYFASVGLQPDLRHDVDPFFFGAFLVFACLIKAGGVYAGARMAGGNPVMSRHLAVALNARGGPGIVLATVALQAQVINVGFYACLVLLAMLTSLAAGGLLERVPRAAFHDPAFSRRGRARSDP